MPRGPISSCHTITARNLAVRVDESYFSDTDPTTPVGQAVLLHGWATIGAVHGHDNEGVMTPSGADNELRPGDKYVFRLLGYPQ